MRNFFDKNLSRDVIVLAYPVVTGLIARTVLGLVDAAMVGRLGAVPLAATGLGIHIVLLVTYSFGSVNIGIQALTARRFGEGQFTQCGKNINGTLILLVMFGTAGSLAGYLCGARLLSFIADDPRVAQTGNIYVSVRLLEFLPFIVIGLYRGFFDGIGKTRINMYSMISMNAANIVLNYLLIFGKFGFPRLEVTGAGIASLISSVIGAGVLVYYSLLPRFRTRYELYKNIVPNLRLFAKIIRLSTPVIVQEFFVLAGFLLFLKIFSIIGTIELAASNVCLRIMSVSFMPGVGLGIAAATLVGRNLGERRPDIAERCGWEAVKVGVVVMGSLGIVFIGAPGTIMRIFTPDVRIIAEGITALRIIGVVQFFDAFGIILMHSLQGAGMTRFVMMVEIPINWGIFLPVSYILGIGLGMGTAGAWLGLALYMMLFGIVMAYTFMKGNWKKIFI